MTDPIHIVETAEKFNDAFLWCSQNLSKGSYHIKVCYPRNNPFEPAMRIKFDRPQDHTAFLLKFA